MLAMAAFKPSSCALVTVAALVIITLVVANSDLGGVYAAVATGWLALHQVPFTVGHTRLGVLPLAPTAVLMWAVAKQCARSVDPDDEFADIVGLLAAAVAGPLALTLVSLAVIDDAANSVALVRPDPLPAMGWVLAVHLAAALGGISIPLRDRIFRIPGLPQWVGVAVPAVSAALRRTLGAAAVVVLASLVWHWRQLGGMLDIGDGVGGVLGMIGLSLLYLPNMIAGAVPVLIGGNVHVGVATVGTFGVVAGPLPPLPALAAVPGGPAGTWWPVLLTVPLYTAAVLGRECAMRAQSRIGAIAATALSAVVITGALLALLVASGGELGSFGRVGVRPLLFALPALGWFIGPGCLIAAFARVGVVPLVLSDDDRDDQDDDQDGDDPNGDDQDDDNPNGDDQNDDNPNGDDQNDDNPNRDDPNGGPDGENPADDGGGPAARRREQPSVHALPGVRYRDRVETAADAEIVTD
jgi:hypothetical protein